MYLCFFSFPTSFRNLTVFSNNIAKNLKNVGENVLVLVWFEEFRVKRDRFI